MGHQRDLALSARSFLRPVTERRIRLNPDLGYWGGVTWACRYQVVNGPVGGTAEVEVVPGENNEMEVLYGIIENLDPAARVLSVNIEDEGGLRLYQPINAINTGFGGRQNFPGSVPAGAGGGAARMIVSGVMRMTFICTSLAANEDFFFATGARVRGTVPTVTLNATDPDAVLTRISDRFY